MSTLSKNIRLLRETNGLTQKEFGAIVGAKNKAVWAWEHANAEPSFSMLVGLSDHFGISLDFFATSEMTRKAKEDYDKFSPLIMKIQKLSDQDRWKLEGRIDMMIEMSDKKESSERVAI